MTTKPAIISTNRKTLQRLADDVNKAAGRTVEAIIQTGVALIKAKEQAGHGGWEKLFEPKSLARPIRFSLRTAVRLMAIAKSPNILKAPDLALLPPAVTVLEGIAKLPIPIFRAAYQGGWITPEITEKDVTGVIWLLDTTGTARYRGSRSKKSLRPTEKENQAYWKATNRRFVETASDPPTAEEIAAAEKEAARISSARSTFFMLPSVFERDVRFAKKAIPFVEDGPGLTPEVLLRLRRLKDAAVDFSALVDRMYRATEKVQATSERSRP